MGILMRIASFAGGNILPIGAIIGAAAAVAIGVFVVRELESSARDVGYKEAELKCTTEAAKQTAEALGRFKAEIAAQQKINQAAHGRVKEAEEKAAAVHRALDAERAAHAATKQAAQECAPGCRLHIPESAQ